MPPDVRPFIILRSYISAVYSEELSRNWTECFVSCTMYMCDYVIGIYCYVAVVERSATYTTISEG